MLKQVLLFAFAVIYWPCFASTVLVIESYHAEYPWVISYRDGLQSVLTPQHQIKYFEMDTKRIPSAEYSKQADLAWSTYLSLEPDLVVIADDNALEALAPRFLTVKTPVVYFGINANPRKYKVTEAHNFSGVIERPLLKRSLIMLQEFLPLEKVLVLFDSKETSSIIKYEIFNGQNSYKLENLQLDLKQIQYWEEWQNQILNAKKNGYDAVIVGLYQAIVDKDNNHVHAEHVIEWTSANTPIPPFGFWRFSIGRYKNIGGYVVSGFMQGSLAGEIAIDILQDNSDNQRPLKGSQGQFVFSKTQLGKWNIRLPHKIIEQAELID